MSEIHAWILLFGGIKKWVKVWTEDPLTQSGTPRGWGHRVGGMILNSLFFKEPLYNIDGVPRIVKKKLMTPNKHILVGEAAFSLNYDTSFWTTTKNSWYPWNNTCPKEFGSLKTRQKIGVKSNPFKSLLANIKVKCKLFWTGF